jgi:hypothetical protein
MDRRLKSKVQGSSLMVIRAIPVSASSTFVVTLGDTASTPFFTSGTFPTTFDVNNSHDSLAEDFSQYPTVYSQLFLTVGDIGDAGEGIILEFFCWDED